MRNRLILILLLCASVAAAQVPSVTGNSLVQLREGDNAWITSLNTIFGAIDVDLTSGVTGILPVANGGTGASSFTANRVLLGNGTSAITTSANLTFSSNLLSISGFSMTAGLSMNGALTISPGGVSISSNSNLMAVTFAPTMTANSLSVRGLNLDYTPANDGTRTGQNYASGRFVSTTSSTTSADVSEALNLANTNSSPNISQLYLFRGTLTENATSGTLTTRTGTRMDVNKGSNALDAGTGTGIQATVADNTASGRWNIGFGVVANVTNAITARGLSSTLTNNKGTGNTQYGTDISLVTSGSGVVSTNVFGHSVSISTSSSGAITNAYAFSNTSATTGITNAYNLYSTTNWRNYLNGSLALGVDDNGAKLHVRGTGNTSGSNTAVFENSSGTDILTIRDDGMSSLGTTPSSTVRLIVRGTTADNTAEGFEVQSSAGTPTFSVDNSGAVSVGNAAYQEKLTVNGKVRSDGLVLNSATDVTTDGHLIYNNASTNSGYFTIGDNSRAMAFIPAMIERHVIDYAVDWTTGRKGAFWTVPARFDGWKIAKAYIEVTSVGSGAGDDVLAIEIGGVTEGEQYITAGTHTLVMDDVINTDDVITFNVTAISATAAKGLHVSLELSKQ